MSISSYPAGTVGIVLGGSLVAGVSARVSVLDRGFLYGDAVSETTRARGGVPFALTEHLTRLERSCAELGLTMPSHESLRADAALALSALFPGDEHAALRFLVTRGAAGVGLDDLAPHAEPTVLVTARTIPALDPRASVRVGRADTPFSAPFDAKLASYPATIRARAQARQRGLDDVLFVTPDGSVIEGGSSNVIAIIGGTVRAPAKGALAGITRGMALVIARDLGCEVDEGTLTFDELLTSDAAFLTSSLRGIARISAVDDAPLPLRGDRGDALCDAYLARFLGDTAAPGEPG